MRPSDQSQPWITFDARLSGSEMVVYVPDFALTGLLNGMIVSGGANLSPRAMTRGLHFAGSVVNRQVNRNLRLLRRVTVPYGVGGANAAVSLPSWW